MRKKSGMVPFTETDNLKQNKKSYFKGRYDMLVEQPRIARRYLKSWA